MRDRTKQAERLATKPGELAVWMSQQAIGPAHRSARRGGHRTALRLEVSLRHGLTAVALRDQSARRNFLLAIHVAVHHNHQ